MYFEGAIFAVPLQMGRNGSNAMVWKNVEPMSFIDWDAGKPSPLNGCTNMVSYANGQWQDYNCGSAHRRIACEAPPWDYSMMNSWIIVPSGPGSMIIDNIFKDSDFEGVNAPVLYGATVQTPYNQCRYLDTFFFND